MIRSKIRSMIRPIVQLAWRAATASAIAYFCAAAPVRAEPLGFQDVEQKAKALLESYVGAPAPDLVVTLTARREDGIGVWTVRYPEPAGRTVRGEAVLPQGASVLLRASAEDIIYEMRFPGLDLGFNAIPGRLEEAAAPTSRLGAFVGDCGVCGRRGAPLTLRVIPRAEFDAWLAQAEATDR